MADVNVWHMTKSDKDIHSFLANGIRTDFGKRPSGGQQEGCYFWTQKKEVFNFADFHHVDKGLIIRVRQPEESISFENGWQHDFERNATMKWEIVKEATHTLCGKNLHIDFRIDDGYGTITRIMPSVDKRRRPAVTLDYEMRFEDREKHFIYSDSNFEDESDYTGFSQALSDALYESSPAYRRVYNERLKEAVTSGETHPLKYTGNKELPIAEIILAERQPDGSFKETTLLSEDTNKKICPVIQQQMDKKGGYTQLMQFYRQNLSGRR